MSTQSGPLGADRAIRPPTPSRPLPRPITMTITDKNIYYVGSPLPRPSKHLSAERLFTITLKSLIQLTGEGGGGIPHIHSPGLDALLYHTNERRAGA